MLIQPKRDCRNINDMYYEVEGRNIARLNEVFGNIKLKRSEEQALLWLAGWEESLVDNVVSAIRRAALAEPERKTTTYQRER